MIKDYNSTRNKMVLPEYGRNVQKMVEHALTIEDKELRNKCAKAIIEVMGNLNPHLRDVPDYQHLLWDHLIIISNFKLDVDSPYPIPTPESLSEKPTRMEYPKGKITFKHYGKILENMIKEAQEIEDEEKRKFLVGRLANLMKRAYLLYNLESVDDETIKSDLKILAKGKLALSDDVQLISTNEFLSRNKASIKKHQSNKNRNNKNRKKKRRF